MGPVVTAPGEATANSRSLGGLRGRMVVERDDFRLDVDLTIDPGTTAALLGPNGAGKSTIVDTVAGLVPLAQGRIELGDRVVDDPERGIFVPAAERRVGVVFQRYLLFEHLNVVDNVAFGPTAQGLGRRRARAIARQWLEAVDLAALAQRRPAELSGGEAQRVALARALAADPEALLLDEPLSALDVATRVRLRRTLGRHLSSYDGPRLLITHDPSDAFLLADRIHVIEDGRITQSDDPETIRRHPATPYVAALAGLNLLTGANRGGELTLDGLTHVLRTADTRTVGPVLITIHPNAVALHTGRPEGSPRNAWPTSVASVEPLGDITRVVLGDPLPLSVDVTPAATAALGLGPGEPVWASVKATEIGLAPAPDPD